METIHQPALGAPDGAAAPVAQGSAERLLHPYAVAALLLLEARMIPSGHGPSGFGWLVGAVLATLLAVAAILMAYDAHGAWAFDDARRRGFEPAASRVAVALSRSALLAALVYAPSRLLLLLGA